MEMNAVTPLLQSEALAGNSGLTRFHDNLGASGKAVNSHDLVMVARRDTGEL
jgi:hypothetical protein